MAKTPQQRIYRALRIVVLLVLWFLILDISEHTIIKSSFLLTVSLLLGACLIGLLKITGFSYLISGDGLGMTLIFYLILSTIAGVIFLAINYIPIEEDTTSYVLKLEQKTVFQNKRGGKVPRAKVHFKGQTKNIRFSDRQINEFQLADSVLLEMRQGNIGYWIFEDYEFITKLK